MRFPDLTALGNANTMTDEHQTSYQLKLPAGSGGPRKYATERASSPREWSHESPHNPSTSVKGVGRTNAGAIQP